MSNAVKMYANVPSWERGTPDTTSFTHEVNNERAAMADICFAQLGRGDEIDSLYALRDYANKPLSDLYGPLQGKLRIETTGGGSLVLHAKHFISPRSWSLSDTIYRHVAGPDVLTPHVIRTANDDVVQYFDITTGQIAAVPDDNNESGNQIHVSFTNYTPADFVDPHNSAHVKALGKGLAGLRAGLDSLPAEFVAQIRDNGQGVLARWQDGKRLFAENKDTICALLKDKASEVDFSLIVDTAERFDAATQGDLVPTHSDLVPGNVMISDGKALILDFDNIGCSALPRDADYGLALFRIVLNQLDKSSSIDEIRHKEETLRRGYNAVAGADDQMTLERAKDACILNAWKMIANVGDHVKNPQNTMAQGNLIKFAQQTQSMVALVNKLG